MIDWQQVSLGQYIQYCEIGERYRNVPKENEELTNEYVREVVKFWTGWQDVEQHDADLIMGLFFAIVCQRPPQGEPVKQLEIGGQVYSCADDMELPGRVMSMGNMSFGEALEALQTDHVLHNKAERIPLVLAILFRGAATADDMRSQAELFKQIPLPLALQAYAAFEQFRHNITESYKPLFRGESDGKTGKAGLAKLNRFGWYNLLYEAAGGRLEHFEAIKAMNVHTVLQFLVRQREEQRFLNRLQQVYAEEARQKNRRN